MSPLVEFIVAQPGMAERMLAQHADDGGGRCVVCTTGAQAPHYRWPCKLYDAARTANEVQGRGECASGSPATPI